MFDKELVAIIDFGSQYTQLIARRLRETNVYGEIFMPDVSPDKLSKHNLKGIILSGGPASVYANNAPRCDKGIFSLGVPILGICYGMQLGCEVLGTRVVPSRQREFGSADLRITHHDNLLKGFPTQTKVWMSHGDRVDGIKRNFDVLATTENSPYAAIKHKETNFYGVQFHPEVAHTPLGAKLLRNFLYGICGCKGDWNMGSYIKNTIEEIRQRVQDKKVLCALSGGVDSSVAATLIHKAIGNNLICVFVDNGLLRKNEAELVERVFKSRIKLNLKCVEASDGFLRKLKGVIDPEKKRKIIGNEFIQVFKKAARRMKGIEFLAQGTLYPDVIESRSAFGGPSATIKTHHNVGGLPKELGFKLIEPLRFLFKDEVRKMGRILGLPDEILNRQPFPGPGLAVRVLSEVTKRRLDILREADAIVREEIDNTQLAKKLWQYFAVLLPVNTVGVMGDERTYENVVALRIVQSSDGMTADWARIPEKILATISNRIVNEVKGVNRVVYDISSKPPSTIEWE